MRTYFIKTAKKVFYKFKDYSHQRVIKYRERVNKKLKEAKQTDFHRWKNNNELHTNWNERTAILGNYIASDSKIIEFGAGNMFLKYYLTPKFYTPSDIIKRFNETVVCDLNKKIDIDLKAYETAVFSGVLEYVYDIEAVFKQLHENNLKQVVLSYCCSDINKSSRDKNGWLSDFNKKELIGIFNKYNYQIEDYQEWMNQSIFNLKLKS